MITFDQAGRIWRIGNKNFIYVLGLKDSYSHHIAFLPVEYEERIDFDTIMKKELRPESQVNINLEGRRNFSKGARTIDCGASRRAEYIGHTITEGDGYQKLTVTFVDKQSNLEIGNVYICYDNAYALKRYVLLKNLSDTIIKIDHLSSFALYGLPWATEEAFQRDMLLYTFPSSWSWEGRMDIMSLEQAGLFSRMSRGAWHIENTGSVSCKNYLPYIAFEYKPLEICYALQIEYSASWRFETGGLDDENGFYVQGGMGNFSYAQWSKDLLPGESFQSAEVSMVCVKGDIDRAFNSMHKHQLYNLIHKSKADCNLPVIFNEWQSTRGAVSIRTIGKHLEVLKGTGIDVYAIDAGWYMEHYEDAKSNKWSQYAGDWEPDNGRFPRGIAEAADMIKNAGMIPGLWFEIEVAALESKAYREKGSLFMKNGRGFAEDNNRRFLYFGAQETREYATGILEKYIHFGFRYFKIDYNADCDPGCINGADSLGQGLVDHMRGYYLWLDELRERHPEIIIESCASGGLRLDYGMLCRSDLVSVTDQDDWQILSSVYNGVSKVIHPSQMGIWSIVRSSYSERETICALINSMLGRMHISGDFENIDDSTRNIIIKAVAFYKKWSDVIENPEIFYHTAPISFQYTEGWLVVQMNNLDASRILVGAWRLAKTGDIITVKLKGICGADRYSICSFPEIAAGVISGTQLSSSFAIRLEEKYSAVIFGLERLK